MATLGEYTQKWNDFFDKGFAPWDTAAAATQLVSLVEGGQGGGSSESFAGLRETAVARGVPVRTCELGCATGSSTSYLAANGCEALGVDIVPGVVELARQRAAASPAAPLDPSYTHRHPAPQLYVQEHLRQPTCVFQAAAWRYTSAAVRAGRCLQPPGRIFLRPGMKFIVFS